MERYRFHDDGALFYVTFTVVDWLPVFVNETACKIIADSFNFCHHNKGLRINAYVVMPTHLHAIVFHESAFTGLCLGPCGTVDLIGLTPYLFGIC